MQQCVEDGGYPLKEDLCDPCKLEPHKHFQQAQVRGGSWLQALCTSACPEECAHRVNLSSFSSKSATVMSWSSLNLVSIISASRGEYVPPSFCFCLILKQGQGNRCTVMESMADQVQGFLLFAFFFESKIIQTNNFFVLCELPLLPLVAPLLFFF